MSKSRTLPYHTLDVFTTERFAGNPLAVVLDADDLNHEQMRRIAKEFNLPETVFVMAPVNPAHSARIRIFTPEIELPFAGHPTVGTAVQLALKQAGGGSEVSDGSAIVILEEEIGNVRVGVKMSADGAHFAEFDLPKMPEQISAAPANDRLAAALGISEKAIGFENHKAGAYSAGAPFMCVPVSGMEALAAAKPQPQHWKAAISAERHVGVFAYTRECVHTTSDFHARMFAPDSGIVEDPATGSAAAAFAAVIARYDDLHDGEHRRIVEQGYEMGRPSLIEIEIEIENRKITNVRIGGHAVTVATGMLAI